MEKTGVFRPRWQGGNFGVLFMNPLPPPTNLLPRAKAEPASKGPISPQKCKGEGRPCLGRVLVCFLTG